MHRIYLPYIATEGREYPCGMAEEAWHLFELIRRHPEQRRPHLTCDPRLVAAANYKASIIYADHPQRGHTFRGTSANQNVEDFGYDVPYSTTGDNNQVESWVKRWSAEAALAAFLASTTGHREHLLALDGFYRNQTVAGVGFYRSVPHEPLQRPHVFVVLTCPPT